MDGGGRMLQCFVGRPDAEASLLADGGMGWNKACRGLCSGGRLLFGRNVAAFDFKTTSSFTFYVIPHTFIETTDFNPYYKSTAW